MPDHNYRMLLLISISAAAYSVPVLLIATLLAGMHTLSRFYVWAASAEQCEHKLSKRFARYSGWFAGLAMGISGLWMATNVGGPAQAADPLHVFRCMSTAHLIWAVGALISLTFLNDVRTATEKQE